MKNRRFDNPKDRFHFVRRRLWVPTAHPFSPIPAGLPFLSLGFFSSGTTSSLEDL